MGPSLKEGCYLPIGLLHQAVGKPEGERSHPYPWEVHQKGIWEKAMPTSSQLPDYEPQECWAAAFTCMWGEGGLAWLPAFSSGRALSHLYWPSWLPALLQICKPLTNVISHLISTLCLIVLLSCYFLLEPHSWESLWIPFLGHWVPLISLLFVLFGPRGLLYTTSQDGDLFTGGRSPL